MGDAEVPGWLKSLPLAPEYHPTETEFADPIAFISRVEEEAAAFGICKVVPPISKPSKKFVFQNLNRSLSKAPELGSVVDAGSHEHATENAVFTTRHQELGSRRTRLAIHKQVWQSGELYTLEQFEAKSRAFARAHLGGAKGVNPLVVEAMFWKAMGEKPVYIEYANDVPGSGFCLPKEPFRCCSHRTRRPRAKFKKTDRNLVEQPGSMPAAVSGVQDLQPDVSSLCGNEWEGSAGWKLSNSPWNLQVIARTPGSLTRFMPDEVPGVTSPMVYIGMLFSWFAWHVEDHELHSLNFLHTGSPKTWYAVPGSCASEFEEVVRMHGYGGNIDRLAAFTLLGEKTTLLSPEVIAQSGLPCCRLVQHPGEFVVTFPRAYHVGFSHGFNCGEAANFATPKWLEVAKEAAVRRAAMNYLPMLSHQQLLYMLTMSFISRVPRDLLPGVRSSRLRDRKKEEREIMVKKAFLDDLTNELRLVHLLKKDPAFCAVLWHPDLLPSPSNGSQMRSLSRPSAQSGFSVGESKNDVMPFNDQNGSSPDTKWNSFVEKNVHEVAGNTIDVPNENISYVESRRDGHHSDTNATVLELGKIQTSYINDDGDLPCDFDLDSGSLACVACGILGYPFMCVVQPSGDATELFPAECEITEGKVGSLALTRPSSSSCLVDIITESADSVNLAVSYPLPVTNMDDCGEDHFMKSLEHETHEVGGAGENSPRRNKAKVDVDEKEQSDKLTEYETGMITEVVDINGNNSESPSNSCGECCRETGIDTVDLKSKWNMSDRLRPRIFCLQHALEVWDILQSKGGARIVIICHSDFLKIKAYTTSVAEDINIQLDCEDVPLKNASKVDLDLVYVSIDDEEHEEGGEDWTAKLGLNLRYCVKLRKQCSSNQEQLTLGLGGIFSKQDPVSAFSGLKWHCRKSRTPHRVAAADRTRSQVAINTKDNLDIISSFIGSPAITQVGKSVDRELQPTKRRGRPRKNPSKEMGNTTEASASEDQTHVLAPSSSGYTSCTDGDPNGLRKLLADSRFPSAPRTEDKRVHKQHSVLARKEVQSSFMVGDFAKAEDSARCFIPAQELADSGGDISDPTLSAECQPSMCNVESSAYHDAGNSVESECQPSIGSLTIRILDTGLMEIQAGTDTITAVGSLNLQHKLTTTKPEEVCNSDILDDQLTKSTTVVEGPELWPDIAEHTAWRKQEKSTDADVDKRMEDVSSIDVNLAARISGSEVSETNEMPSRREEDYCVMKFDLLQGLKEDGLLKYERRRKKGRQEEQIRTDFNPSLRNKRKREKDQITSVQLSCYGFIRSPCEGLRPRNGRAMCEKVTNSTKETSQRNRPQGHDDSVGHKDTESRGTYQCDLQGCHMNFQTGKELDLHKRNRCTYEGCGKRFISHKYAMRHQCVHAVDRPLKCPWKGCNVTFKWAWARTEHVRVHTGERPYKCKVSGCGMTFRFVSDFSRHKRKTGHSPR